MATTSILGPTHPSFRSLSDLQRRLWPLTYNHAITTQFYRTHYSVESTQDGSTIPPLDSLPTTRKEDLQRAGDTAQATGGEVCREIFTGGSGGQPFVFKVRDSELRFLWEFFSTQVGTPNRLRRGIRLADLNFVNSRQIPVPIRFHELSLYGKGNIEYGLTLLGGAQAENGVDPHVTILAGGERALRAFSLCASKAVGQFNLDIVYCYGTYLTSAVRRDLEKQWGASVVDRYALSEVFGGATQNPTNGWYHFEPWVISEFLDIATKKPIDEGIGVIVLTSLYPFQQAQPIIRYWTGDLARVSHSVPGYHGKPLMQPLGRLGGSIVSSQGSLILLQSEIADTVDHSPYISNIPWFQDNPTANPTKLLGYPTYKVDYNEFRTHCLGPEIIFSIKWKSPCSPADKNRECQRISHELTEVMRRRYSSTQRLPSISFCDDPAVVPRFSGIYQQ